MILVIVRMTLQSLTPRSKIIKIVRKLRDVHYTAETELWCASYTSEVSHRRVKLRGVHHTGDSNCTISNFIIGYLGEI